MRDFPEKWARIKTALAEGGADAFWLLHHASYLMRTSGALWLVDPVLDEAEHDLADGDLPNVLRDTQAVFITHLHADHYDPRFLSAIRGTGALVVLPSFLTEEQRRKAQESFGNVRFVEPGEEIAMKGLRAEPFVSLHKDMFQGVWHGLEEYGYRIVCGGRSFLFPGDVRSYDSAPPLPGADELFAHVWMGRRNALTVTRDDVERFCRYFAASGARRIWLAHLYDYGRDPADMWTEEHARLAQEGLRLRLPEAEIRVPDHGAMMLL